MNNKVVILYGGTSAEYDISCITANSVAKAMEELNIDYIKIDLINDWITKLKDINPSFVFLALHGCPGEDGTVQAVLDFLNIPYNGSGVLSSALAMDKSKAKKMASLNGVDIAKEIIYKPLSAPKNFNKTGMSLPVVVKPVCGGSSIGNSIVKNENEWQNALENVKNHGTFMLEEYIDGKEFSVGFMADKALVVTEIIPPKNSFYDYQAKYAENGAKHITPADISKELTAKIMQKGLKAIQAIGCKGVTRVDFIYNEKANRLILLEVNTLPGLTPVSIVPEQANYKNINFNKLILWIMEDAGYGKKN